VKTKDDNTPLNDDGLMALAKAGKILGEIEAIVNPTLKTASVKLQQDVGVEMDKMFNPMGPTGPAAQALYDACEPITEARVAKTLGALYLDLDLKGRNDLKPGLKELMTKLGIGTDREKEPSTLGKGI
jgi:hypothetical protein